jgi:tripartite-type tricarboxylate transporter receptor subunit TctC
MKLKSVAAVSNLLIATSMVCAQPVLAQAYPSKPVRVVIPFPSGGDVEGAARFFSNHLANALGQSFVLEPRPGGNTLIGAEAVARSPADGYTLFFCGPSTFTINPTFYGAKLPYDYARDFTPISIISSTPYLTTVAASLPAKTIPELLALARAEPGKLSFVSSGSGSSNHLAYEILVRSAGVSMIHVPYKGMQLAIPDLLSGRVTTLMAGLPIVGSGMRSGKLRAIAVTSRQRFSQLPDVPAVSESGLAGYDIVAWFALFAPAKTPPDTVVRLNGEIRKYMATAEAQEEYLKIGHDPVGSTIEQLAVLVKSDTEKYDRVIREANIRLE